MTGSLADERLWATCVTDLHAAAVHLMAVTNALDHHRGNCRRCDAAADAIDAADALLDYAAVAPTASARRTLHDLVDLDRHNPDTEDTDAD